MASLDDARSHELTVVLTGAESSGKTTLARTLSQSLDVPWIEECARHYLAGRSGYVETDLLTIARVQAAAEAGPAAEHPLLIADTDLLVVKIWSEVRFGCCDPEIEARIETMLRSVRRRLYLIPRPDIPWVPDPLREHPHERMSIHARHLELLTRLRLDYRELTGPFEERLSAAIEAISARRIVSR